MGVLQSHRVELQAFCMKDRAIQEELNEAVRSPEHLRRYVKQKKMETAFRLWDLNANGKVFCDKITRSLLKCVFHLPTESDLQR